MVEADKKQKHRVLDAGAKRDIANKILDGKLTFTDARRLNKLQAYQLWAWIGQAAYARLDNRDLLPGDYHEPRTRVRKAEPVVEDQDDAVDADAILKGLAQLLKRGRR